MTKSKDILSEIGLLPISLEQPVGINVRYDEDFEFIEDELSKQGSMIDRGQVNWDKITQIAINILSNKSKDLKVSCYLTRALFETKGFSGLQMGLSINCQLLMNFWADVFPVKQRARANSYEWLTGKFESSFENLEPDLKSLSALQYSYKSIKEIEQFLNEKLSDRAPVLGNFRRSIYELLEPLEQFKKNEDEKKAKQKVTLESGFYSRPTHVNAEKIRRNSSKNKNHKISYSKHAESNQTVINSPDSTTSLISKNIESDKDKNKIIRQCHEALGNISSWSINKSLDSPSAYAMNRFSTWMGISQLPIHDNNVTPLKPLPKDKINTYINLFNSKKYQDLIPQVEQSFSKSPFWLDAHRLVSSSLLALGLIDASNQVKDHLGIFLRRFPDLIDLKFSDHSNFADQLTKQWVNSEVLVNNLKQFVSAEDVNHTSEYENIVIDAQALVTQNKMIEAIRIFQNKMVIQRDLRKKTFWKYYLAQFLYDNGEQKIAFFLLKEIDGLLQKNGLKFWELDLEKNVVHLLIKCLRNSLKTGIKNSIDATNKAGKNKEHKEINKLYSRLCQLDPVLALDIQ